MSENKTSEADAAGSALDYAGILRAIPHRHPFLFVDAVKVWEKGKSIEAVKNVSFGDDFFQGHFPAEPVMPGVLQIEALAQACCILIALSFPEDAAGKRPAFAGIEEARFRKPVRPGDILHLHADLTQYRRGFATFNARAEVRGEKVCDAVIKAAMI
jgi:3-hydroxyacyl-[acyl-carrier-protein] dehydratase